MASLSNSRWQNRKEPPIRSTTYGDMAYKAKRPESESVTSINHREAEFLTTPKLILQLI